MARVFIDGFEAGDLKLWDVIGETPDMVSSIAGMDGTYCVYVGSSEYFQRALPAAAEYYFAFRFIPDSASIVNIIKLYAGATAIGLITRSSAGFLEARVGSTVVATGPALLLLTTYLIEVRYKIANSGGIIQVKADGILVIDYSGDTQPGADTTMNQMRLGYDGGSNFGAAWFDNVVVDNAAWPGNTNIQAIRPTGAGAAANWTPSAGNNWDCVEEVPANETDYVATNTANIVDTYVTGNMTGLVSLVKCVQVQALTKFEGAPTPANLQLVVRPVATDRVSASIAIPAASAQLSAIWETNPDTANAWAESEINGSEIGVKAVA